MNNEVLIFACFTIDLWPLKRSIALQLYGTDYNPKYDYAFASRPEIPQTKYIPQQVTITSQNQLFGATSTESKWRLN